jgi:membrane protease YdiL (CAAX protease family)
MLALGVILPAVWAACAIAGILYAHQQNIPQTIVFAVLPAILWEVTFYYALAHDRIRERIEKWPPVRVAGALTAAAITPYLFASFGLGSFTWRSLLSLAILAAIASFWYVLLPEKPGADLLFIALMSVVMLVRVFPHIYVSPHPKVPLSALGQAMWVRTGVFVMLAIRKVPGVGFGFWPTKREWKVGAVAYVLFLLCAFEIAIAIKFAKPHWPPGGWEKTTLRAVATFFGTLWVLALGEEFLFRGLLQQWLTAWTKSVVLGLVLASLIFGSVHLWFRPFPNWRLAILAAIAGVFYGAAFNRTKSIRASMVTHALVVTTWRVFFW